MAATAAPIIPLPLNSRDIEIRSIKMIQALAYSWRWSGHLLSACFLNRLHSGSIGPQNKNPTARFVPAVGF